MQSWLRRFGEPDLNSRRTGNPGDHDKKLMDVDILV
jgi:hypothetical protein